MAVLSSLAQPDDPMHSVRSRAQSTEPHMRHANIVLRALDSAIAEQRTASGATDAAQSYSSATVYFAAIASALDSQPTSDTLSSLLYLLSIVLPQLSIPLLKSRFDAVATLVASAVQQNATLNDAAVDGAADDEHRASISQSLLRAVLDCCGTLLGALEPANAAVWRQPSASTLVQILLIYTVDRRPKLRKHAQSELAQLLSRVSGDGSVPLNSALSDAVRRFFATELSETAELNSLCYCCNAAQWVIPYLPLKMCGELLSELLSLLAEKGSRRRDDSVLHSQAFKCCLALFEVERVLNETAYERLVGELLDALLTLRPRLGADFALFSVYSHTLVQGFARFQSNTTAYITKLNSTITAFADYLQSTQPGVSVRATDALLQILQLAPSFEATQAIQAPELAEAVTSIVHTFEGLCSLKYRDAWTYVFNIIAAAIACLPAPVWAPVLRFADSLISNESVERDFRRSLDTIFSTAVRHLGVEYVLTTLPLNLPDSRSPTATLLASLESARTHLLPALASAQCDQLHYFTAVLYPEISGLMSLRQQCVDEAMSAPVVVLDASLSQLWAALPALARYPVDLKRSYQEYTALVIQELQSSDVNVGVKHSITQSLVALLRCAGSGADGGTASLDAEQLDEAKSQFGDNMSVHSAALTRASHAMSVKSTFSTIRKQKPMKLSELLHRRSDQRIEQAANAENAQQYAKVIKKVAKQVLPVLLNLYLHSSSSWSAAQQATLLTALSEASRAELAGAHALNAIADEVTQKFEAVVQQIETSDAASALRAESQQVTVLGDLLAGIAASLDAERGQRLFTLATNKLNSKVAVVQKRMYKLCGTLFTSQPSLPFKDSEAVLQLITDSGTALQPAAAMQRMMWLQAIVTQIPTLVEMQPDVWSVLPSCVGELILGLKSRSARLRTLAYTIITELAHQLAGTSCPKGLQLHSVSIDDDDDKDGDSGVLLSEFVYMLLGGMAGSSAHMQSASLLAIAKIIYELYDHLRPSLLHSILSTTFTFFEQRNRELLKSLLGFSKVAVLRVALPLLEQHLQSLVAGLALWCDDSKNKFKLKIRILFGMLTRRFGADAIRALVPKAQQPLLTYVIRMNARSERHKAEAKDAKRQAMKQAPSGAAVDDVYASQQQTRDSFERLIADSGSEIEDDADDAVDEAQQRGGRSKDRKRLATQLRDADDFDLLEPTAQRNIPRRTQRDIAADRLAGKRKAETTDARINEDDSGRIVINESAATNLSGGTAAEAQPSLADGEREAENHFGQSKRRRVSNVAHVPGGESGARFRSKKAGGDVQRANQPAPYAYVPLHAAMLNKRAKHSAQRRFQSVINGAKQGAKSGQMHGRSRRTRAI